MLDSNAGNIENLVKYPVFVTAVSLAGYFVAKRFRVAGPNQTLIRFGLGYGNNIKPSQSGFVWPGQEYRLLNMEPTQARMVVSCNSKELIPFNLPIIVSTQPVDWREDLEGFLHYCKTYADASPEDMRGHMEDLLAGDIRTKASTLTVSDMIAKGEAIYDQLEQPVHTILRNVGIHVQKCNIEEVLDILKGGGYIDELRKKAIASAQNTAETDVKKSEIERRIAVAEFEKDAVLAENRNRQQEAESRAELAEARAAELRRSQTAAMEAKISTELRQAELEKECYIQKQRAEEERIRMETYVKANIEADARVREAQGCGDSERSKAEGTAAAARIRADADRYSQEQHAQSERYRVEQVAEGKLASDLKAAQGAFAMYKAKADGIREVNDAAGDDPDLARLQMMLEGRVLQDIAQSNADALRGMNPTVWYTGGSNEDPMRAIMGGLQQVAPFLKTMGNQAGMDISRMFPQTDQLVKSK